jgi:predicted nucleic acid-binding protein
MAAKKVVLCDSSALISMTNSCLIDIMYFFTKSRNAEFVVPQAVEREIVERPLAISMKAYELSAMRMKKAIEDRILNISMYDTLDKAKSIMDLANTMFYARANPVHLVDLGEADMIALASETDADIVLMDERTTRMLIESPFALKDHMEKEMGVNVMVNKRNFDGFKESAEGLKVIRSSELVAVAYSEGYFSTYSNPKKMLESSLYSLKYGGCSIGFDEIDEILGEAK